MSRRLIILTNGMSSLRMNSSRLGGMFRNYLELVQWAVSPLEVEDLC